MSATENFGLHSKLGIMFPEAHSEEIIAATVAAMTVAMTNESSRPGRRGGDGSKSTPSGPKGGRCGRVEPPMADPEAEEKLGEKLGEKIRKCL